MKIQKLFLFGLMFILTSCPMLFAPIQLVPTSGKIENWQTGKLATVRVRMGDNGNGSSGIPVQINDDGTFSNIIYPTPLDSDLQSITISPNCASSFTVVPSDVKFTYGTLGVTSSQNNTVGIVGYSSTIESSFALLPIGSISVIQIYADKEAILDGFCSTTNFKNINLKAGWNLYIGTKISTTNTEFSTGLLPPNLKFYFNSFGVSFNQ